ncbi:hypothetical protein N7461_007286, partial [Penicillium sp. DV-2018c]
MPVLLSWQDNLLHECTTFQQNLQSQSLMLRHLQDRERNNDASRAIVALSLQTDSIVEIGLSMISKEPDSILIRRDPAYWHREGERMSPFESVFISMERRLDKMALALKRRPGQQECRNISTGLEEMASEVGYLLRGVEGKAGGTKPGLDGVRDDELPSEVAEGFTALNLAWYARTLSPWGFPSGTSKPHSVKSLPAKARAASGEVHSTNQPFWSYWCAALMTWTSSPTVGAIATMTWSRPKAPGVDAPFYQLSKRAERGFDSSLEDGKGCWLYLKLPVELRKPGAFGLDHVIDAIAPTVGDDVHLVKTAHQHDQKG